MDPEDTEINYVVHPDALIDLLRGKLELEKKQTVIDSEHFQQSESSQDLQFDNNKDDNESNHIIAAMRSIGMPLNDNKITITLS